MQPPLTFSVEKEIDQDYGVLMGANFTRATSACLVCP